MHIIADTFTRVDRERQSTRVQQDSLSLSLFLFRGREISIERHDRGQRHFASLPFPVNVIVHLTIIILSGLFSRAQRSTRSTGERFLLLARSESIKSLRSADPCTCARHPDEGARSIPTMIVIEHHRSFPRPSHPAQIHSTTRSFAPSVNLSPR